MMVSICVPIYNVSDYIDRCVNSLFNQTYNDIEFIFVDDCSPDDSIAKIKKVMSFYNKRKQDVTFLSHNQNRGLAAARNTAVEYAHGDFIMHVDPDDWLEIDAVECLINKQYETGADIVYGNAIAHYSDHEELLKEPYYNNKDDMMRHEAEMTLDHVLWRRLIRRKLYTNNNIFAVEGVNVGEDHYTLPKLIYYANKCTPLDKVIYHYNRTNTSSYLMSNTEEAQLNRFHSDIASIDILLDFFKDKDEACLNQLMKTRANYLYSFANQQYFNHKAKYYNEAIGLLYEMGCESIACVGIKGLWKRFVYSNYLILSIYKRLRGIVYYGRSIV